MKCECGKRFTDLNDFYMHICDEFGTYMQRGCKCKICGKEFKYWTELAIHLANDEKKCVE